MIAQALDPALPAMGGFYTGLHPQVDVNKPLMYPIYAACCELEIPMEINTREPTR